MADDLDRLLDEVERRLSRRHGSGQEKPAATKEDRSAKLVMSAGSSEEDLDDIIDEICKDSSFTKTPPKLKSNFTSFTPERNSAVVQARGKKTCDQLRCTACDFRVSLFNDYVWDQSCDYLFFRNNMPELSKLRAKMIKKKGARAYACQCSWRSIDELTDLQTEQQLRQARMNDTNTELEGISEEQVVPSALRQDYPCGKLRLKPGRLLKSRISVASATNPSKVSYSPGFHSGLHASQLFQVMQVPDAPGVLTKDGLAAGTGPAALWTPTQIQELISKWKAEEKGLQEAGELPSFTVTSSFMPWYQWSTLKEKHCTAPTSAQGEDRKRL
ncbi:hypothetical protein BTVI_80479 [Pitangus sulphuratus]|nr:hypothetical protein BTVI_80479 [Pitangus sulphuratus]